MIYHRNVFYNLVFTSWFYPLQKSQNWKSQMINSETASFIQVRIIRILLLFISLKRLFEIIEWIINGRVYFSWRHHKIIIIFLKQKTAKLRIFNQQWILNIHCVSLCIDNFFNCIDSVLNKFIKVSHFVAPSIVDQYWFDQGHSLFS